MVRMGRMTASQKAPGGVRGIGAGDMVWCLVSAHDRPADSRSSQEGKGAFPIRFVLTGRLRVYRPCTAGLDRRQPKRTRFHIAGGHDEGTQGDGRERSVCRETEENNGTHSCQPCFLWANIVRWRSSNPDFACQSDLFAFLDDIHAVSAAARMATVFGATVCIRSMTPRRSCVSVGPHRSGGSDRSCPKDGLGSDCVAWRPPPGPRGTGRDDAGHHWGMRRSCGRGWLPFLGNTIV